MLCVYVTANCWIVDVPSAIAVAGVGLRIGQTKANICVDHSGFDQGYRHVVVLKVETWMESKRLQVVDRVGTGWNILVQ
jgi:hypothetical protein